MSGWTAPKDVILYVAGKLTVSGATNAIVEYIGPGARTISATGKATITNMGAELGATTSIFPADEHMARYLRATGTRRPGAARSNSTWSSCEPDPEVEADPAKYYDRVVELDLSTLEPHIVGPHSPDRARPISLLAAEVADPKNGFIDADLDRADRQLHQLLLRGHEPRRRRRRAGQGARPQGGGAVPGHARLGAGARDDRARRPDAVAARTSAAPCWPTPAAPASASGAGRRRKRAVPNTIVTSYNRNFPRRNDGQPTTMNFIGSPEIVTAMALAGRLSFNPLTDTLIGADGKPFRFEPPKPAPEVPAHGFDRGHATYIAPPEDGSGIAARRSTRTASGCS